MAESPVVQELANARIRSGTRMVRIDLRDCTAMDSTFSGMLLVLKRVVEASSGELVLVAPSRKVIEVLRQMGIEDFYATDFAERPPATHAAWREVAVPLPELETLQRVVLESHEELSLVPGPAAEAFREVVRELRRADSVRPSVPPSIPHA